MNRKNGQRYRNRIGHAVRWYRERRGISRTRMVVELWRRHIYIGLLGILLLEAQCLRVTDLMIAALCDILLLPADALYVQKGDLYI